MMKTYIISGLIACSLLMMTGCYNGTSLENHKTALVNAELGLNYLAKSDFTRAKTKLTRALDLSPKSHEAHSAMAYFLEKVGEMKEAEKEHKKAIQCSRKTRQKNSAVYNNYGAYLCRAKRFEEADRAFKIALKDKQYPKTSEIYENAGVCAFQNQAIDKGKNYLIKAMQHNPQKRQELLELMNRLSKTNAFHNEKPS